MIQLKINGEIVNVKSAQSYTLKIAAHKGDNYVVMGEGGAKAPNKLITKKVKKALEIYEEGSDIPSVVVEDYYAEGMNAQLYGVSGGETLPYAMSDGGMSLTPTLAEIPAPIPATASSATGAGMSTLAYIGGALAVGGVALAAGGGGGGGAGLSAPAATTNTISGTITMGPAVSGNQLSISFYQADGVTLIATATVNANGTYSANIGTYTGAIIARVVDSGSGVDYMDEATGVAKDLNAVLMTVAVTASGANVININPITTIAAQKAGLNSDGSGSVANVTDIQNANQAVATLFGLGSIVTTTPTTTLESGFNSSDGLSSAEKYGAILAALSGADGNTEGGTQAVIDTIVAGLDITTPSAPVLDTTSQSLILAGANTAAVGNQTDNSGLQSMVSTTLGMNSAPLNDGSVSALTPTQIANLTLSEVVALTPAQITLLGTNIASMSAAAIASLTNEQTAALSSAQVSALTTDQMMALSAVQIAVLVGTGAMVADTIAPTATITMSDTALKIGETSTVTITFSEAVKLFSNADVTVENGTLSTFSTADNIVWTATFTPTANITDTANVITLANTYTDLAFNAGTAATSANYLVDGVAPTAAITMDKFTLKIGETAVVTITFSEAVSSFDNTDVAVANGMLTIFSSADGGVTWTATFTPTVNIEDTTNIITLANTYTDVAGNAGASATSANYIVDGVAPTATITMSDTSLKAGEIATVTITFSEAVADFSLLDVTPQNGTIGIFTTNNNITWTATFTPTADITDTTNVIGLVNTYTDMAGNTGTMALSDNYVVDTATLSATITMSDTALKVGETSTVTVTFSGANASFSNADITVENGTLSTFTSSDNITWTATFTPSVAISDATNAINLTGSYADVTKNYAIDTAAPTATITMSDTALKVGETATVTITFSEAVNGFSNTDVTAPNGTLSTFTSTDNITWTATFTPSTNISDTTNVIALADTYTDSALNAGTAASSTNYTIDNVAPTATITMSDTALKVGDTSTVTIVFNEAVNGFSNADVTLENGTLGTLTTSDNITWTATFTPTANITDTTNLISIANTYTDMTGNAGATASSTNYTMDTASPTATIIMDKTSLKSGQTATVTITFSEAVSGFDLTDLTAANGTLSNLVQDGTNPKKWTATFTPDASISDTTNVITLANTYTDSALNTGSTATSLNYTVDTTLPSATISMSDTVLKVGESATVTVTFSAANASFTNTDITAVNGTFDTFVTADAGVTWTAIFTPTADLENSLNTISLIGSYTDVKVNYAIDTLAPSATVTMDKSVLKAGESATVTITFSEIVSGFDLTDLTAENGVLSNLIQSTSNPQIWFATFTPSANINDTTNVITLAATYTDGALNTGAIASSANYAIATDIPSAVITMSDTSITAGETSLVTITFSEAVSGFDNTDVTVENGTLSTFTTTDNITWSATFTPSTDTSDASNAIKLIGSYIDADSNVGNTATGPNYVIATKEVTGAVVMSKSSLLVGETALVTITFSTAVSGFDNTDVTVANGTLSTFSTNDNIVWNATFTPSANITDTTNVITLANTYSGTNGAVGTGSVSANYAIDTTIPTASITMSDTALKVGETSTVTITFSEAVSGFSNTDVSVANGTLSTFTTTDNITWSATFTPSIGITDTTNIITLANTYTDTSGNRGTGATGANYTMDTAAPTATITMSDTTLKAGESSTVTIVFSEAVSGFSNADVIAENGTLGNFMSADGITWIATFTPSTAITDTTNIITLANTYTDALLNTGTTATSANYTVDTTLPSAAISMSDTALRVGESATVTVTFSAANASFTNADITAENGTLGTFITTDSGVTWTATFTPNVDIEDTSNLIALTGGYADVTKTYTIDTAAPTATITMSDSALKIGETSTVTITFSEVMSGFDLTDLSVQNGSLSNLTQSTIDPKIWTAVFTPTANITDTTNVITLANTYTDAVGNTGTTATSANYEIDTTLPNATITMSDTMLKAGETATITVTFSFANPAFTNSDVTVENGTLSTFASSDGGLTYTATFTPTAGLTDTTNAIRLIGSYTDVAVEYAIDKDAPVFSSAASASVAENIAASTVVYDAEASDNAGAADAGVIYTLTGADAEKFTIDATGQIRFITSPNYESRSSAAGSNAYALNVIARDSVGNTATKAVTINVTNVAEEQPLITSATPGLTLGTTSIGGSPITILEATGNSIGSDTKPKITILTGGGYVVAWEGVDSVANGSDNSIYVQQFDASGTKVGSQVMLETTGRTDSYQYAPEITALSNGGYVVAWQGQDPAANSGDYSGYCQRFNADGTLAGSQVRLEAMDKTNDGDYYPNFASFTNGSYVVTWQAIDSDGDHSVYLQRFNADGTLAGSQVKLEPSGQTAGKDLVPRVTALADNSYVVTWSGADSVANGTDQSIYLQRFNADGTLAGSQVMLEPEGNTYSTDSSPQITPLSNGGYVIIWQGTDSTANGGDTSIYLQRFNADGTLAGAQMMLEPSGLSSASNDDYATIAQLDNGRSIVVWKNYESGGIRYQLFNADGSLDGETKSLLNLVASTFTVTSIGSDGSFVISGMYQDIDISGYNVYMAFAQKFYSDGSAMGGLQKLSYPYAGGYPAVTSIGTNGEYIVTWSSTQPSSLGGDSSVYVQRFDASGNALSDFSVTSSVAMGSYDAIESYTVYFSEGSLVANGVTYTSGATIAASEWVNVQLVGVSVSTYDLRVSANLTDATLPPISVGAIVTGAADTDTIFGTLNIAPDGFSVSGSANPNTLVEIYNGSTKVGSGYADDTGNYTIRDLAISNNAIVSQFVAGKMVDSESFTRPSAEILIGRTMLEATGETAGADSTPRITTLSNGGYAVTWQGTDSVANGIDTSVYIQQFDASGTKVGTQVILETPGNTLGYEYFSPIASLLGGGYVVGFRGYDSAANGGDGSIYIQQFDANGSQVGSLVKLEASGHISGLDNIPQITALSGGGYVVTWQGEDSATAGNTDTSIYVQQFDASGSQVGSQVKLEVSGYTAGNDTAAQITPLGDGGYVVTWQGGDSAAAGNTDTSIYVQRFDASGSQVGSQVKLEVSGYTAGADTVPQITALSSGGYVVTWQGVDSATAGNTDYSIYVQQFDASGSQVGSQVKLEASGYTAGNDTAAQITPLGDGGYVVGFHGYDSAANGGDGSIYIQQFDANGSQVGSLVKLEASGHISGLDNIPQITALSGGGYVVTWQGEDSATAGNTDTSIYVQQFDASGSQVGSQVKLEVSGYTAGNDTAAQITPLGDGGYVVTWQGGDSAAAGNTDTSIYVQRFDAQGRAAFSGGVLAINAAIDKGGFDTIESYTVNFNEGTLTVNGVTYTSGATISASEWINPTLSGISAATYSLEVIANLTDAVSGMSSHVGSVSAGYNYNVINGTFESNTLTGTALKDLIYGGAGDDTLNGEGGSDEIYGQWGNDTLLYSADAVKLDGGEGIDTLRTQSGGTLDFSASIISHIEKIDLYTDTAANTLNIRAADILGAGETNVFNNTTFGGSILGENVAKNQILINAEENDTINLDASGWSTTQSVTLNGHTYNVYNHTGDNAQLLIENYAMVNTVL